MIMVQIKVRFDGLYCEYKLSSKRFRYIDELCTNHQLAGGGTQSTDPRNPTIVPPPHVVSALNRSCDCDVSPPRTWLLELSHWIHPTQDIHHNPAAASICNYFSRLARLTASPALASGRETHCE